MEFTVTTKGPTLDQLTRDTVRDLRAANKTAGRRVARVGKAAVAKGAPTMWGRKLGAKTKTTATATECTVTFTPSPAGGWAIAESGTRPHKIAARQAKALHYGAVFAEHVNHPGTHGRKAWTKAGERIAKAVETEIVDVYGDALNGTGG